MINFKNIKAFDKNGHLIDWEPNSDFKVVLNSTLGYNAEILLDIDINGKVTEGYIVNPGYNYASYTKVNNEIVFKSNIKSVDITHKGKVIFKNIHPEITYKPSNDNTGDAHIDNIDFRALDIAVEGAQYPSITYTAVLYFKPVSCGLFENQSVHIFDSVTENGNTELLTLRNDGTLRNNIVSELDTFNLYEVDETNYDITLSSTNELELNNYIAAQTPVTINIAFKAADEGVYEGMIDMFYNINDQNYLYAQILLMGESIGEDERYRGLLSNFGLPDPVNISKLFKESDINEHNIDYKLINEKSKFLALEYQNIFSYIGTYKALINAVKWLGYDDIYFREWFLNSKTNKINTFKVNYDAKDRTDTILSFSLDERANFKKMNKLTLVYCLNKMTDEYDIEHGTPVTEKCFNYTLDEMRLKLYSLKEWLEEHIIGVNCKIIDITAEGIYFATYENLIYANADITLDIKKDIKLTPTTIYDIENQDNLYVEASDYVEAVLDDNINATLGLGIKELMVKSDLLTAEDLTYSASDIDSNITSLNPIINLAEIQWRASVETKSSIISTDFVDNELLIFENTIKYADKNILSSTFKCDTCNVLILLEKCKLRNLDLDWELANDFTIEPGNDDYILYTDNTLNSFEISNTYVVIETDADTILKYEYNDKYKAPLLTINKFKIRYQNTSGTHYINVDKEYILDIEDGKICLFKKNAIETYINFNYDNEELNEQHISVNYIYYTERKDINSIIGTHESLNVHHAGKYNIELFAWDNENGIYYHKLNKSYNVSLNKNKFDLLYESNEGYTNDNITDIITHNQYPEYEHTEINSNNFSINDDYTKNIHVSIPSISYYIKKPDVDSFITCTLLGDTVKQLNAKSFNYKNSTDLSKTIMISAYNKKYKLISNTSEFDVSNKNRNTFSVKSDFIHTNTNDTSLHVLTNKSYVVQRFYKSGNVYNKFVCNDFIYKKGDVLNVNITLFEMYENESSKHCEYNGSARVLDVSKVDNECECTLRCDIPFWILDENGIVINRHNPIDNIKDKDIYNFIPNAKNAPGYSYYYVVNISYAWDTAIQMHYKINRSSEINNYFKLWIYKHNMLNYIDNNFVLNLSKVDLEYIYKIWGNDIGKTYKKLEGEYIKLKNPNIILTTDKTHNIWELYKDNKFVFRVYNDNVPIKLTDKGKYDVVLYSFDGYGNMYKTYKDCLIER